MAVKLINTGGAVKVTTPNTEALKDEIKELQGEVAELQGEVAELQEDVKESYGKGYEVGYDEGHLQGNLQGYTDGYEFGKEVGIEEGKKAEYDVFWDGLQDNGNRTDYPYLLYRNKSMKWFKPKYDIRPTDASRFANIWGFYGSEEAIDLVEVLKECGVVMDFSQSTSVTQLFYNAKVFRLPELNFSNASPSSVNTAMFGKYVVTIDKFIVPANQTLTSTFDYSSNLENIVFGSEIGGDISMSYCKKLSKDSIRSVIEHLSDTTTGLTATLSSEAVNNAYTSEEWETLRNTKKNWTITTI